MRRKNFYKTVLTNLSLDFFWQFFHTRDGTGTVPNFKPTSQSILFIFLLFLYKHSNFLLGFNSILQRVHKKPSVEVNCINYHYPEIESISVQISERPVRSDLLELVLVSIIKKLDWFHLCLILKMKNLLDSAAFQHIEHEEKYLSAVFDFQIYLSMRTQLDKYGCVYDCIRQKTEQNGDCVRHSYTKAVNECFVLRISLYTIRKDIRS